MSENRYISGAAIALRFVGDDFHNYGEAFTSSEVRRILHVIAEELERD